MKRTGFVSSAIILSSASFTAAQTPIGTTFTYQGRMKQGAPGNLVTNSCDFRFKLFGSAVGADQVGPELIFDGSVGNGAPIAVTNGLFRADLDFGAGSFNGDKRWLEIRTRVPHGTPGDPNGYVTVSPRQELTPTPYALQTRRGNALDAADGDPANALFVDSVGNVGVGTETPAALLHIGGPVRIDNGGSLLLDSDNGVWGRIRRPDNQGNAIRFGNGTNQINGVCEFRDGNETQVNMVIENGGNVGIGTVSPEGRLHVRADNDGGPAIVARFGNAGLADGTDVSLQFVTGDGVSPSETARIRAVRGSSPNENRLAFHVDVGEVARFTAAGNVGIGTTSPEQMLHIKTGAAQNFVLIETDGAGHAGIALRNSTQANNFIFTDGATGDLQFQTNNNPRMEIDTAGNIGVGTTAPAHRLHVKGDGSGPALLSLENNGPSQYASINFTNSGVSTEWSLGKLPSDTFFISSNENGAVMNMTKSGLVGLSRFPLTHVLEVEGTASKTVAGDWVTNSDRRIKTDIQPVTGGLAMIDRVNLVSFRYNDAYRASHPSIQDRRYLNVIAQEFAEVFPDHVTGSGERLPDGGEILQVDPWPITIYSAAAIQELHASVREKQSQIDDQQRQIGELTARLAALEAHVRRSE